MRSFDPISLNRSASEQLFLACQEDFIRLGTGPEAQQQAEERVDAFVRESGASPLDAVFRLWRRSYGRNESAPATKLLWQAGEKILSGQVPSFRIAREYCLRFGIADSWAEARRHHLDLESYCVGLQISPTDYPSAMYIFSRSQFFLHPHDPDSLIALALARSAPSTTIEKWADAMQNSTARRLRRAVRNIEKTYHVQFAARTNSTKAPRKDAATTHALDAIIADLWRNVEENFTCQSDEERGVFNQMPPHKHDAGFAKETMRLFALSPRERAQIPRKGDAKKFFFEYANAKLECFLFSSDGAQAIDMVAQSMDFDRLWRQEYLLPRITWMHHHLAYRGLLSFIIKEAAELSLSGGSQSCGGGASGPEMTTFLSSRTITAGSVSSSMLPASPSSMLKLRFRVNAEDVEDVDPDGSIPTSETSL